MIGPIQLGDGLLQAFPRLFQPQLGTDARLHDGQADGLGDIIHRSQLKATGLIGHIAFAGDENHRNIPRRLVCLQMAAHLVTIHVRHHHIQQNQIGMLGARHFQRLGAAGGDGDAIAVPQLGHQRLDVGRYVIHGQNAGLDRGGMIVMHSWSPHMFPVDP